MQLPVHSLAVAVQQQVNDEGLPSFFLAERVQGRGHEGKTQRHHFQGLTTDLLVLAIRLLGRVCLAGGEMH